MGDEPEEKDRDNQRKREGRREPIRSLMVRLYTRRTSDIVFDERWNILPSLLISIVCFILCQPPLTILITDR